MKNRIFITGGGGMLASEIERFYLKKKCAIYAPTHNKLNILDRPGLEDALFTFRPDYIFHTAALHVNDCEENPELAFNLNSWASCNIARTCSEIDATLIYISSCCYFGDEIKYYSEYDPVVLKTIYAKSKFQGEVGSLKECKNTFAIRPGWLFGGSIKHKKNFVYQRYLEAKKSPLIKSANDKFGCPTYIGDLVKKIDEIINLKSPGIYHVSNSGGCSRFEYVNEIIKNFKLKSKVIGVDSSNFPRKANVPNCEFLLNLNLKFLGLELLPPWQDAIERYAYLMLKDA